MEQPYQRPVPGPREVRTRHHPGGGRADAAGARAHTHAKGTRGLPEGQRTELAERTDRVEWRTSERASDPDGTARHTQRGTRWAGRGKRERHNTRYRPEPPEPAARGTHTRTGHCTRQGSSGPSP